MKVDLWHEANQWFEAQSEMCDREMRLRFTLGIKNNDLLPSEFMDEYHKFYAEYNEFMDCYFDELVNDLSDYLKEFQKDVCVVLGKNGCWRIPRNLSFDFGKIFPESELAQNLRKFMVERTEIPEALSLLNNFSSRFGGWNEYIDLCYSGLDFFVIVYLLAGGNPEMKDPYYIFSLLDNIDKNGLYGEVGWRNIMASIFPFAAKDVGFINWVHGRPKIKMSLERRIYFVDYLPKYTEEKPRKDINDREAMVECFCRLVWVRYAPWWYFLLKRRKRWYKFILWYF